MAEETARSQQYPLTITFGKGDHEFAEIDKEIDYYIPSKKIKFVLDKEYQIPVINGDKWRGLMLLGKNKVTMRNWMKNGHKETLVWDCSQPLCEELCAMEIIKL